MYTSPAVATEFAAIRRDKPTTATIQALHMIKYGLAPSSYTDILECTTVYTRNVHATERCVNDALAKRK